MKRNEKDAYLKQFASNIKYLRQQKNLTRGQIAIRLKVNKERYEKWEEGVCFPNQPDILIALMTILDATIQDMLTVDIASVRQAA